MDKPGFSDFSCSIARTLDVVGERWTLLILRDLFAGMSRYDEIQKDLGIASNILATRLSRMLEAGLIAREQAAGDARSWQYSLTDKGRELYPVVLAIMAWGDKWLTAAGGQPVLIRHIDCGQITTAVPACSACGKPLALHDIQFRPGPGGKEGPGTACIGRYLAA